MKPCASCKHGHVAMSAEPCDRCEDFALYEPKGASERHQVVNCDDLVLSVTSFPCDVHLVRIMRDEVRYDRMIVVAESQGGLVLTLWGWVGRPLALSQWRAAKRVLFPRAVQVAFERWSQALQAYRWARLEIGA